MALKGQAIQGLKPGHKSISLKRAIASENRRVLGYKSISPKRAIASENRRVDTNQVAEKSNRLW